MKLDQARTLVAILQGAILDAEAEHRDEIDIQHELSKADDAARADLQQAILQAQGKTS